MAKRLVELTLMDGKPIVINFDHVMFLEELMNAQSTPIGTVIAFSGSERAHVSESLQEVIDAAEKA